MVMHCAVWEKTAETQETSCLVTPKMTGSVLILCQSHQEGATSVVLMTTLKNGRDGWKQESLLSEVAIMWPFSEWEALRPESCVSAADIC